MVLSKFKSKVSHVRLDSFLSDKLLEVSRSKVAEFIRLGFVKVNSKMVKRPSCFLNTGDTVSFKSSDLESFMSGVAEKSVLEVFGGTGDEKSIKEEAMDLNILYEDDDILVLDKQSGIVVHPGVGNYTGTLVNGLVWYFKKKGFKIPKRVGLVHRLDKDVSGLMVVAKNNEALSLLSKQFSGDVESEYKAVKTYWAVVRSSDLKRTKLKKDIEYKIEGYIKRSGSNRRRFMFTRYDDGEGRYSLSYIKVLKIGTKYSLVQVRIVTGRTHQIRVHLSSLGVPIIGDSLYGSDVCVKDGIALRCVFLSFIHPGVYKTLVKAAKIEGDKFISKDKGIKYLDFEAKQVPLGLKI